MPQYESGLFDFKNIPPFENLKKAVGELCARDRSGFYYYTLHDLKHIDSCMEILELFFGKLREGLSSLPDIFNEKDRRVLVAAVYLHDIGLYITENESEKIKAEAQKKDIYEFLRETHHERIEEKISQWYDLLRSCGLDYIDISDLCLICRGHRKVNLFEYRSRIRKLSAVLRLVDELDIGENRAPAEFLKEHILKMDLRSRWHWIKHYFVAQWREENIECQKIGDRPKLVFKVQNSLPARYPQHIFLKEINKPINRVIQEEGVGNIFKNDWGFEVEVDTDIPRLLGKPHRIAGIDLIDSLKYYLNYYEIDLENSIIPGDEDDLEEYCRKIYNKSPGKLPEPLKTTAPDEYYSCIEKTYKNEIEKKVRLLAEHYDRQENRQKAVKYYLLWANIENSYIPTDTITDKIFISNEAISKIEKAYKISEPDRDSWNPREQYDLLIEYGRLKRFRGQWDTAREIFTKCLDLSNEIDDDELKAESRLELGSLIFEMGYPRDGFNYVNQALDIQKTKGIGVGLVKTLRALGNMHREQGDWDQALETTKLAADLMKLLRGYPARIDKDKEELVKTMILCDCHRELGNLYATRNEFIKAEEYYKQSLEFAATVNPDDVFNHLKGIILYHRGNLELKQNNIPKAEEYLKQSEEILEKYENPIRKSFVCDALGRLHSQSHLQANLENAEKYFIKALDLRRNSGHEYFVGLSHYNLGVLYKRSTPPQLTKSIDQVNMAIEIFRRLEKYEEGDAYFTLGQIYLIQNAVDDARTQFNRAGSAFKRIYGQDSEKVRMVDYEIKKIDYGESIPFKNIKYLIEAGEYRFHDWLREYVKIPDIPLSKDHLIEDKDLKTLSQLIIGGVTAGDDAAVVRIPSSSKYDLLITTDAAPGSLTKSDDIEKGRYAARFSVIHSTSDILAMGGIPIAVLLNLYLTRNATFDYSKAVIETVQSEAAKYGMALIGGDLKERDHQSIGCVGMGLIEKDKAIYRNGAKIGDIVAVTLTQNIKLGTRWLHEVIKYKRLETQFKDFLEKNYLENHLLLPREEILAAAKTGNLTSAIDTSDGILGCLQLIGKLSNVGFILEEQLLKKIVHPEVEEISKKMAWNPIQFIFNAGHDWEIVVTVKHDNFEETRKAVQDVGGDLAPIGKVVHRRDTTNKLRPLKIKMENSTEIELPYFTDEKFVWNPYQNRVQEWLDNSSLFSK